MKFDRISGDAGAIPPAVRDALGVREGDVIIYSIEGNRVTLAPAGASADPFINNFATFTEWASEADCEAFDNL